MAWTIATNHDPEHQLGAALAAGVPGIWVEHRLGRWPAYVKRCDGVTRERERLLVARALAGYVLNPNVAGASVEAQVWMPLVMERIHAFCSVHSRIVVPWLVRWWLPFDAAGAGWLAEVARHRESGN